jgi:hypothetical protein
LDQHACRLAAMFLRAMFPTMVPFKVGSELVVGLWLPCVPWYSSWPGTHSCAVWLLLGQRAKSTTGNHELQQAFAINGWRQHQGTSLEEAKAAKPIQEFSRFVPESDADNDINHQCVGYIV